MKCPIDQTEMEKGFIAYSGQVWKKGKTWTLTQAIIGGDYIIAYRCPKCGKIELTTEPDKKEGENT